MRQRRIQLNRRREFAATSDGRRSSRSPRSAWLTHGANGASVMLPDDDGQLLCVRLGPHEQRARSARRQVGGYLRLGRTA
jgi:hypothetical protein